MTNRPSEATLRNWRRLAVTDPSERLQTRANKTSSARRIVPLEYLTHRRNLPRLQQLLALLAGNACRLPEVLFSLGRNLLRRRNILARPHVRAVLAEYPWQAIAELETYPLPEDEFDFLGLLYQCLKSEGEKNRQGSYYTPLPLIRQLLQEVSCPASADWLDPCCGSGAFLLAAPARQPQQLTGIDIDELAVMLAKINLLLKFPEQEFSPRIFCANFLHSGPDGLPSGAGVQADPQYDCIVSNPPWGACIPNRPGAALNQPAEETFSSILQQAYRLLRPGGELHFLLPEAALQIKAHREFRRFLLQDCRLHKISAFRNRFAGVSSRSVGVSISRDSPGPEFSFCRAGASISLSRQAILQDEQLRVQCLSAQDRRILSALYDRQEATLAGSTWGLGIVTGDNRGKLCDCGGDGLEAVYTGREISEYQLLPPRKFIRFDRTQLQQAAPDHLYRAPAKLVYKFISPRPVFTCDQGQHLFLNSANMLIPAIPGLDCVTVLAFLNSQLFRYIYQKQFTDLKVLQGNLLRLPFPAVSSPQNRCLSQLAQRILAGETSCRAELEEQVFAAFAVPDRDRDYILQQLQDS
ncbi:MAG: N-6 DNA methylase [Oligosphaeraceae bacterium]|nr:N-6 DNA methylase [Oligosphaeraceae bacterium]